MNPETQAFWIVEGLCPEHGVNLVRKADCGWCAICGYGWSARKLSEDEPFARRGEWIVTSHHHDPDAPCQAHPV